jgi:putative ABC transport system permease protein
LAIAGVAVIGALLFDMLLLSRGLLVSFRALLDEAGYDVRVAATDSVMLRVPIRDATAVAAEIARLPDVREVAIVRRDRATLVGPNHHAAEATLLNVSENAERHTWRLLQGAGLTTAGISFDGPPVVLSRRLANTIGAQPGSTVLLRAVVSGAPSAAPPVEYRVAGVADFGFETSDDSTAATTPSGFARSRASQSADEADMLLVRSRGDGRSAAAEIGRERPDLRAFSNEQLVAQLSENGFAYFRQISIVLSSITLGFAFLLVATLLTVSVNQRLGQVAALRALGLPRRRIAATLLWESGLLVGVGGLLSVPVGWGLALRLDRILRDIPGIPDRVHFFVFDPNAALLHLLLLAGTGLAAAAYPVWVATRLPIAATLRLETVS